MADNKLVKDASALLFIAYNANGEKAVSETIKIDKTEFVVSFKKKTTKSKTTEK